MTWIKVTERLPRKEEFILLGWDGTNYYGYDKIDRLNMKSIPFETGLTHWMPLPNHPEDL